MEFTYLGTAAAEGFPALFCNCEYCREARRLGGKNVRTRSQSLINDDLLIDFPPDTYMHILQNGIEGDKIKYLLITHSHTDHLYREDIGRRTAPDAHELRNPVLKLLCSAYTYQTFQKLPQMVDFTVLQAYKTAEVGNYRITPLPARHAAGKEAFIYIIESDKTLLYAHDTGYPFDEVFDYIEKSKTVFDMISLDCTNVDIPITDEGSHMGFPNNERVIKRLEQIGAVTEKTVKYVNHFSHNGNPLHHLLENRAAQIGCHVSFDGCSITL